MNRTWHIFFKKWSWGRVLWNYVYSPFKLDKKLTYETYPPPDIVLSFLWVISSENFQNIAFIIVLDFSKFWKMRLEVFIFILTRVQYF